METDGGKAWKVCVEGNAKSFEDVYKANGAVDIIDAQAAQSAAKDKALAALEGNMPSPRSDGRFKSKLSVDPTPFSYVRLEDMTARKRFGLVLRFEARIDHSAPPPPSASPGGTESSSSGDGMYEYCDPDAMCARCSAIGGYGWRAPAYWLACAGNAFVPRADIRVAGVVHSG
eukprot:CAMPEP_0202813030 /NCGR_PEP_ID=MMETSP1389-20130828/4549_1 /ASSEMBLY_ACC=CAM_ASM_000865 /TAXON_ID=302021 /ORGANISM="Rhodomonas sp., Strain CCMP768" /LENGTH=172 /DNA_ID=CAMNT_0049484561 /DNA_START=27 /DNA_END=544 /DNA_ORIENTATION=-